LARRLGKHPSFVNKIELMERRLDIVEFVAIARALKVEPAALFSQLQAVLPREFSV
jgi:transcriptional regulator with XRE-family HTH domain